jgi:hypothetical protein
MTMFLESPIPVIFIGIIAEAVLATFFFSMRKAWTLWAMLGVLVLVFAGVGLEWVVVTDVEQVEARSISTLPAMPFRRAHGWPAPSASWRSPT